MESGSDGPLSIVKNGTPINWQVIVYDRQDRGRRKEGARFRWRYRGVLTTKPIKAKPQPSPAPQPGASVTTDGRLAPQATSGAIQSRKDVRPAPHLKPFGGQMDPPARNFISVNAKVAEYIDRLGTGYFINR